MVDIADDSTEHRGGSIKVSTRSGAGLDKTFGLGHDSRKETRP